MSEKKNGNELADMGIQALTDNDLEAVAGGWKHYCKWRKYWVDETQNKGLIFCGVTGYNWSLQKAPCDSCDLDRG